MPNWPDTVPVKLGRGGTQDWVVDGLGECSACSRALFWCITPNDKRSPVDREPDDEGRYTSHFATCPRPGQFRKRRKSS